MNKVSFSSLLNVLVGEISAYRQDIFRTLILGIVCSSSKKCISGIWERFSFILTGKNITQRRLYEFLNSAKIPWKAMRLKCLKMLGKDILTDGRLLIALDDTTYGKHGKKIAGTAVHFDHAAKHNASQFVWGHCRVVSGILTSVKGRWAFLPWLQDNFVPLKQSKKEEKNTKIDISVKQIMQIANDCINENILVVCDSWFGVKSMVKEVMTNDKLHVLSRLRSNAVLYETAIQQKTGRGRKNKYGKKIENLQVLANELKSSVKMVKIEIYSKLREVSYAEKIVMSKALGREIKVVLIYLKNGQVFSLFTTDLTLCAVKCIEYYGARWKIEAGFKELKHELGVIDSQARNLNAVENHFNLACTAMTLVWIYAMKQEQAPKKRNSAAKRFSFADIRAQIETETVNESGIFDAVCPNSIKLAGKYLFNKIFARVS